MFTIGDKVAYPMHGAGVIEGIEEQTILGEPRSYYILRLSHSDMKVMRNLLRADSRKKLSTGEKKMLSNAKQLLMSEIVLAKGVSADSADKFIEDTIMNGVV